MHAFSQTSRPSWLAAALAATAALVVYAVTLGGTYVYDDTILREDPRFTHPAMWGQFWTDQYMPGAVDKLYRPLTCLTFAVEHSLHGDRPWIYHLVNLLLHTATAAAVADLARRLAGFAAACTAGVLFAVHPVHVEAVAGLVGRAELLCTLAIVLALIFFLKPLGPSRVIGILVCFVTAVLSKEQGILLPALLLAIVPLRRRMLFSAPPSTSDKAREGDRGAVTLLFACFCIICAAYLVFRDRQIGLDWDRQHLEWTANPLIRSTGADRWRMPIVLLGRYTMLLLAPAHLSLDYGAHVIGWTVRWREPWFYLGAAALLTWLSAMALSLRHKRRAAIFCLLGLALTYGMVGNWPILIGTILGERLMYLPSVFFLILIAALLARLFRARPRTLAIVVGLLAAAGSIRTFTYARLWNDPLRLCVYDLGEHPMSMHLHSLVVDQQLSRGDYPAAREVGRDSIRRLPDCWESYRMVVAADVRMHDFTDARQTLTHVDRRCPGLRIARLRTAVAAAEAEQAAATQPR